MIDGDANTEDTNSIDLPDLDPTVFEAFLRLLYQRDAFLPFQVEETGLKLLEIADRFGCKELKHMIKSEITEHVLKAENAADLLIFADSFSCPFLKEAAIDVFKINQKTVMDSPGWETLQESAPLLADILRTNLRNDSIGPEQMDVSTYFAREAGGAGSRRGWNP